MQDLAEGSVFGGRYRIVRVIAKGGMGAVYEVLHLETERRRALKVMLPHLVSSDELRQRFRQEARVAAKVESAFIVDVFDAGIDDETQMPFLVMELLRGEELGKRLARRGRFPAREVVAYLGQTALALDKTHQARIVHRDLKPENLFLAEQDDGPPRIKVLDFGIAKLVAEQGTEANATQSIGTPMYMAPEQFQSGGKVSPATDMFSLGMMAYTLLVGSPYWREEKEAQGNVYAFVGAVMAGPMEAATERAMRRGVELPVAFDAWFAQATARDPAKRFGAATEAIAALAAVFGVAWSKDGASGRTSLADDVPPKVEDGDDKATVVLPGKTPAPAELTAHATGYGLSSSHSGAVRAALASPRRRSSALFFVGTAFVVVLVGLIVVGTLVSRNADQTPPEQASAVVAPVVPLAIPSAEPSAVVEPRVDVVAPLVSAMASTKPVEPRVVQKPSPRVPAQQQTPAPTPPPAPAPAPAPTPALKPKPAPTWGL